LSLPTWSFFIDIHTLPNCFPELRDKGISEQSALLHHQDVVGNRTDVVGNSDCPSGITHPRLHFKSLLLLLITFLIGLEGKRLQSCCLVQADYGTPALKHLKSNGFFSRLTLLDIGKSAPDWMR